MTSADFSPWPDAYRPRLMTQEEAAWVREQVWPASLRKTFRETPAAVTSCACQSGRTQWCQAGRHTRCVRGVPLPEAETFITCRAGRVLYLPGGFAYPTPSATGFHATSAAQVWLADRVCRWVCPCRCHSEVGPGQQALFGLAASPSPTGRRSR